jgi:hypothetical protein
MSKLVEFAKSNVRSLVLGAATVLGGAGYYGYEATHSVTAAAAFTQPEGAEVRVSFPVASGVKIRKGVLLNDKTYDSNDSSCHTVLVPNGCKGFELVADVEKAFGKTFTVTGRRSSYKGRPQIEATSIN